MCVKACGPASGVGSRWGAGKLSGSEAGEGSLWLSGSFSPGPYSVIHLQSSRVTFIPSRPWRVEKSGRRSQSAAPGPRGIGGPQSQTPFFQSQKLRVWGRG